MLKALAVVVGLTALSALTPIGQQPSQSSSPSLPDGQMMTMPSITSRVMPTLTTAITGDVDIETVVGATGVVAHTRVAKSADPSGALDRSCVDALKQWRFGPAMKAGRPSASLVLVRFSVAQPAGAAAPVVNAAVTTVEYSPPPQVWTPLGGQTSPVKPGSGVQWPSIIREVKPSYTPAGMRANIAGQVEMEVIVGPDGTVVAAQITKGLDADNGLDNSALIAARYWLFNPGTRDGVPVPTKVGLVLEFRLR